jgi:hypothetical protein
MAQKLAEFQVFVVEVCRGCGWNHLVEQYLLGRNGLVGAELTSPTGRKLVAARKSST